MAVRFMGTSAPYRFRDECTWCYAVNAGTLTSTGFGSCVGLVLHSDRHDMGVVAHFSGSLGKGGAKRRQARNDTQEILRAVCPVLPGIWKAWVFGGKSLRMDSQLEATSVEQLTKPLIDLVREQLRINPYIPINSVRANRTDPEMQDGVYVGHRGVALNVATGAVTWDDG